MPRPSTSARPTGRADAGGRHRSGRPVSEPGGRAGETGDERGDGAGGEWDDDLLADTQDDDGGQRVPLLSVPESLRSLDVQVGVRAVRGLLLLALVVILVLGGRWWWVQQGAGAVPVEEAGQLAGAGDDGHAVTGPVVSQGASAGAAAGDVAGQRTAADEQTGSGSDDDPAAVTGGISVVVHVVGEVRRPGIVELPAGARVADAVAAVGGLTDAADQTSLNLARALVDGEQVWVGAPGEEPPAGVLRGSWPAGPAAGGSGGASGAGASGDGPGAPPVLLDLNRATQAELEELPGIGPVTAGHILTWREEHGRFSTVEELMEVSGIGERTFAQLEPLVTVGG